MLQNQNSTFASKAFVLLLVYFLTVFGYTISSGLYRLQGFFILVFALTILGLLFFKQNLFTDIFKSSENLDKFFAFSAILSTALSFSYYAGLFQTKGFFYYLSLFLLLLSLSLMTFYLWPKNKSVNRFYFLVGLAAVLRILMLISSPDPAIDVFDILKLAPQKLIHGENPYQTTYSPTFVDIPNDRFAYPPGAFLATLPVSIIFGDPRLTNLIAEILTALILFTILKKRFSQNTTIPETLSLRFLVSPRAPLVVEQAWLEPTILFLLLLSYFLYEHKKRHSLALIIFGFLITIKQTLIFLPIFLWRSLKLDWKKVGLIAAAAFLIIFPFFIWSPSDFWYDTVSNYFNSVARLSTLIHQSLDLGGFLFNAFKIEYPSFLSFLITIPALIIVLKKQSAGWSQFFLSTTLFYFTIFVFGNQSFLNFYYFIGQLILVNIALLPKEKGPKT